MKVFNLRCDRDHRFEGWFDSDADRQRQLGQGLLTCPLCGSVGVALLPSAPHVQLNRGAQPEPSTALPANRVPRLGVPDAQTAVDLQTAWVQAVQHLIENTDDVGDQFADEARRIHYGEVGARSIRGQATLQESQELLDEGIKVLPVVVPEVLKGTLQ